MIKNQICASNPSTARYKINKKCSSNKLFKKYVQDNSIPTIQEALIRDKQSVKKQKWRTERRKNKLQETYEQNCRLFLSINNQKSQYALPIVKEKASLGINTTSHKSRMSNISMLENKKKLSLNPIKCMNQDGNNVKILDVKNMNVMFTCTPNSLAKENMNLLHRRASQNKKYPKILFHSPQKANVQDFERPIFFKQQKIKQKNKNIQHLSILQDSKICVNICQILHNRNTKNQTQMRYFRQKTQFTTKKPATKQPTMKEQI